MTDPSDWRYYRFARTQRETNAEHLPWAERLPPLKPMWHRVLTVAIGFACAALLILLGGAL